MAFASPLQMWTLTTETCSQPCFKDGNAESCIVKASVLKLGNQERCIEQQEIGVFEFAAAKGNTLPLLNALTRGVKYNPEQRELKMAKDLPVC